MFLPLYILKILCMYLFSACHGRKDQGSFRNSPTYMHNTTPPPPLRSSLPAMPRHLASSGTERISKGRPHLQLELGLFHLRGWCVITTLGRGGSGVGWGLGAVGLALPGVLAAHVA